MNKDLMMKAAIKYKGKWSEDSYDLIVATPSDITLGKRERDGSVTYVSKGVDENTFIRSWSHCTRDQFETFVESLFEGAPDDATHRGKDNLFYRINDNSAYFWNFSDKWARDVNGKEWLSNNLIPRPAKVEPEAPYMPKVGEECEAVDYDCGNDSYYQRVIFIGDNPRDLSKGSYKVFSCVSGGDLFWSDKFRPLRTERELFIEQATRDYLDQVGSDAVNAKWFERIFGALYDAGNLSYKN